MRPNPDLSVSHPVFLHHSSISTHYRSPFFRPMRNYFVVACYATLHPITPSVSRSVDPSVRHTLFFRRLWGFMLCSAPLCYARFTCSLHAPFTSYLTHFAHFLVGTVEIHRYVFTLKMHFTESLEILVDNRNTQYMISFEPKTAQKRRRIDIWADRQANE